MSRGALSRSAIAGWASILFYGGSGIILHATRGEFSGPFLAALVVAFALVSGGILLRPASLPEGDDAIRSEAAFFRFAPLLLVVFAFVLFIDPLVIHARRYGTAFDLLTSERWIFILLAAAIGAAFLTSSAEVRRLSTSLTLSCAAALLLILAAKVLTLIASPRPFIDVFTTPTLGSRFFLSGLNPYGQTYPDIYRGEFDYPPGYVYWPGVLYLETVSYWLLGDIRGAFIFADVVTVVVLVALGRRAGWSAPERMLFPLLWLAFPVTFYVLESAWVDTLLVMLTALLVWSLGERRWLVSGVLVGALCGVKQYAVFVALLAAAYALFQKGWKEAGLLAAGAVVVFSLIVVPFLVSEPDGFWRMTIQNPLRYGMRLDSLTLTAAVARGFGYRLPGGITMLLDGLALAAAIDHVRRMSRTRHALSAFSGALVVVYGVVFLCGSQAFCNYYFLLSFFALLHQLLVLSAERAELGEGGFVVRGATSS